MQIRDSVVLITGGASGLGAETASRLAAAGAKLLLADLNEEAGQAHTKSIGNGARFVRTDVTDDEQVSAAFNAAKELGTVRAAVNCAGIAPGAKLLGRSGTHPIDLFQKTIAINLFGTFNVMRHAAAAIAEAEPAADGERGVIINTASVAAFEGQIGQVAYSASKGGVAGMTLPAARDLAPLGIRVVAIAPGVFETPMVGGMPDKVRAGLEAQCIFPQRLGQPSEYAQLVQHVLENVMLNGGVIRLDGGVRLAAK